MDKAQSAGFAAGRAVFGKGGLLAGWDATISARWRVGAAPQLAMAAAMTAALLVPNSTKSAVANGDTRTITLSNGHTNESGSFTFMVNGIYDLAVLDKLNWFLRDWRLNEPTKMDPHLFDIIWEVYRESGSTQPMDVLSGYRSPQTNAMLRRRSRQVAEHSAHMAGKAIDAHFIDVGTARIRDIAMRMEAGGVGFYPTGITPWVHIDSGPVRYWPRMSRDALARLFPDGKTVFIPADGQPMPGYEQARAEIEARGGQVQVATGGGLGNLRLAVRRARRRRGRRRGRRRRRSYRCGARRPRGRGTANPDRGGGDGRDRQGQAQLADRPGLCRPRQPAPTPAVQPQGLDAGPDAVAKAKRNLPTGPAYASAAQSAPTPPVKPQVVVALVEPNAASDASPSEPQSAFGAKLLAPLPPRRPTDLDLAVAFADAPMPPARPATLILTPQAQGSADASWPTPSNKRPGPGGVGSLPPVIMHGIDGAPVGALALAEASPAQKYSNAALLARAAELALPLPPMPIPDVGAPATAPEKAVAPARSNASGGPVQSATMSAEEIRAPIWRPAVRRFQDHRAGARPSGSPVAVRPRIAARPIFGR